MRDFKEERARLEQRITPRLRQLGAKGKMTGKRIVIATFGSLGDLHPVIALGLGLKARGHHVSIAVNEFYRRKIEPEGLEFHPIPPERENRDPVFLDRLWSSLSPTTT